MERLLYIIPECYVDTNLISTLVNAAVNHQKCCTKVTETLNKRFSDNFAVGIIDRDKVEPKYVNEFQLVAEHGHLQLLRHKTRPHYLLTISPAVEMLIIDSAAEIGLDLKKYGLSSDLNQLKKLTKKVTSNTDSIFTRLFKDLGTSSDFSVLATTLNYLVVNKFKSNEDELKKIFKG
ncbi:MAG: hypothetical protein II075_02025 [Bacteroidales bacterium]|nr:hypothetical protein [Bacteroidales bacterium]